MSNDPGTAVTPTPAEPEFHAGLEDLVILPLVVLALVLVKLLRAAFTLLIRLLDFLFPILLQLFRFPLFTLRMIGDAVVALLKGVVRLLPASATKRDDWRERIALRWAWLRQKISYHAFEEWVHHAFEAGMAWVFRSCKTLTPGGALLVLFGAVLWLPISFGIATGLHAWLFAKATTLPAWMQLLHPLATVIAKSKLLVLPVYPAAWPQAKKHGLIQTFFGIVRLVASLYLVRKTRYRYRQADNAAAAVGAAVRRRTDAIGLHGLSLTVVTAINRAAAWSGRSLVHAFTLSLEALSKTPVIGPVMRRYAEHYEAVERAPQAKLSEKVGNFYARWSIKFTAKYYEDREREEAAKAAQAPSAA